MVVGVKVVIGNALAITQKAAKKRDQTSF